MKLIIEQSGKEEGVRFMPKLKFCESLIKFTTYKMWNIREGYSDVQLT